MASKVTVIITDDIDGSEDAETVIFGFDGIMYEIDLAKKNRAKLERTVAPYVAAGRKVTRRRTQGSAGRSTGPRVDRALVRAWAKEHGLKVSDRGRISADVMQQYGAAN